MPDNLAKPIPLLITENVAETLTQIRVEQGYHFTLSAVERINEENHAFNLPAHLKAIVDPDDPQQQDSPSEGEDEYLRTYVVHVWVIPSQTNGVPLDETFDLIAADVIRCLCNDETGSYTRGGYAIDTKPADTIVSTHEVQGTLAYLVNVPVVVQYTTRTRNPYQQ